MLAVGISAALFVSVFAAMSAFLLVIMEPPYILVLVTVIMVAITAVIASRIKDELSKSKEVRRV